jgi:hypothetical protein
MLIGAERLFIPRGLQASLSLGRVWFQAQAKKETTMAEMFQKASEVRQVIHPAGQAAPFDTGTGAVGPVLPISAVVGVSGFSFDFFNEGGTNNLLPGRPTTQTASFTPPRGAGAFVCLSTILGAFVTNGGANLTERPLGEFEVSVGFAGPTTLSCTVRLTDSNSDDPVKVSVRGLIVFFR